MTRHSAQQNVSTFFGEGLPTKKALKWRRRTTTNNHSWQKQNKKEISFPKPKREKSWGGERRENKVTWWKHPSSLFLVSTHTPNSSLLFRTQWLLFPPPRYAYNAILFFSRSSAVRVGGSLPRFRPTRYFSPLIIENGCVPKKKKFLAPRKGE